jgi:succinate dehydrogenase/fumarate reductase flavoprotein subunit
LAARGDPGRVVAGRRVRRDATRRRRMTPPVAFASSLETEAPRAVAVVEEEGMEPFWQIRMDWSDMFEIEVFPVVSAEQGLQMARQAMSSGQG